MRDNLESDQSDATRTEDCKHVPGPTKRLAQSVTFLFKKFIYFVDQCIYFLDILVLI